MTTLTSQERDEREEDLREQKSPRIADAADLPAVIREAYLDWPTLNPSPRRVAVHMLRGYDFQQGFFPPRASERTMLLFLENAIGVALAGERPRTDEQQEAIEHAGELVEALAEPVDKIGALTLSDSNDLQPLVAQHFGRLLRRYDEPIERFLRQALGDEGGAP